MNPARSTLDRNPGEVGKEAWDSPNVGSLAMLYKPYLPPVTSAKANLPTQYLSYDMGLSLTPQYLFNSFSPQHAPFPLLSQMESLPQRTPL